MNSYLDYNEVRVLNVDINSSCNAACQGCARQISHLYKNPFVEFNKHMSFDTWKKIIDEIGTQLTNIIFCGNYGDAGATKDLPKFIEYAVNVQPSVFIIVTSNMGINSTEFWKNVVTVCPNNLLLQCSIDGLADTNHIYRRFVRWEKVLENVTAALTNGANAEWKFIEFPWNVHQINDAKNLSKHLGFKNFVVLPNNNPIGNEKFNRIYNAHIDVWNDVTHWKDTVLDFPSLEDVDAEECRSKILSFLPNVDYIDCYTKKEKSIHIDWNGHVWPCCWYGGIQYYPSVEHRKVNSLYTPDLSTNWNNVNVHSLKTILDHSFYKNDLMASLNNTPNVCCYEMCGKCNNKYNVINTVVKLNELNSIS